MISFCELTFIHATVAPRMGKYRLLYAVNALVYNTSRRLSRVYLPCTNLLHQPVVERAPVVSKTRTQHQILKKRPDE